MLEAFVESLDNVPEAVQSEYKQVEGGYQLDVKEVKGYALENIEGLRSALGKERNSNSTLTKELNKIKKEFDGIDPMELVGVKAQLDDVQQKYDELLSIDPESKSDEIAAQKVKDKMTKAQKDWEKQYNKEVGTRDEKITTLTSQLQNLMIHSTAVKALAENGAGDSVDLLLPHVLKNTKLVENDGKMEVHVVDSEGNPRVRSDGRNMSIEDLMPEFKDKWPNAFNANVKSGGGTPPNPRPSSGSGNNEMTANDRILAGLQNLKR
jgi:hypothetical protein